MAIYRGDGGAGDATNDVTVNQVADYVNDALTSKNAAATSATNAATSAGQAATSATNAATSATSSASSAAASASSATAASTSASNASTSATNASVSATSAATSASTATTQATNAATSATNAATSESNAAASESAASISASTATTQATNAATSATNAATSASNAATSESNAATSATSAATSATNAGISETNASASATAAAASAASAASSDYAVSSWFSTTNNSTNWDTAYGWGNHALAGYLTSETYTGTVTSVAATVPAGFAVTGSPITTTGTLAIAFDTGYSLPTTASQANWDTAYGWGDHALAGYERKNAIINGNFDVWQRGTSSTTNNEYGSADRWRQYLDSATGSTSQQAFTLGQTDVPNNPTYFMRFACTTAPSTAALLTERIEDVTTFAGETITVSFYAKSVTPTNISNIVLRQAFGTGGSPSSVVDTVVQSSVVLTTSWQRFEYQVAVPSVSGKTLGTNDNDYLEFRFSSGNATFSWDIAQVQLEKGSVASGFERRTLDEEMRLCRWFYKRVTSVAGNEEIASGFSNNAQLCRVVMPLDGDMRVKPTLETTGTASDYIVRAAPAQNISCTTVPTLANFINGIASLGAGVATSALTPGEGCTLRFGTVGAYLGFDSEI